jgi:glucose-6-phosphate 1-dehydrogenase
MKMKIHSKCFRVTPGEKVKVEVAWRLLMPVLGVWAVAPPSDFPNYAAGTWGPEDTQGLLAHGHGWPLST